MTEINVVGYIGIAELFIFFAAPFIFLKDQNQLRRDGFMPFVWLAILTIAGGLFASWRNHSNLPSLLRGFAATYSIFANVVVFHRLLRKDFRNLKWFVLGCAISVVLNLFIFQRGASRHSYDTGLVSSTTLAAATNSALFWAGRLPYWIYLPIRGWFLSVSRFYMLIAAPITALVCLFFSHGSGRGAAICAVVTFVMLYFAPNSRAKFARFKRQLIPIFVVMFLALFGFKAFYEHMALTGRLGEGGLKKIEKQSQAGRGVLQMLIAGRSEFFIGVYAGLLNPIVGYGPWAVDKDNIVVNYLAKYGSPEDYEAQLRYLASQSVRGRVALIPAHSCLICFWVWYGLCGLILWGYVIWIFFRCVMRYCGAYIPWYGYIATVLPIAGWDVLFSPYGCRVTTGFMFVVCLYLKAAYEHRIAPGGEEYCYLER